jgi:CheY-like chemotaxis protein
MPEMSGLDLIARLRVDRPSLRVMYMSGYPEPTTGDGGGSAPGAHFLVKPFDRNALLAAVRQALDARFDHRLGT